MKRMNIAKRVLACGLAVAMVVTGGNYSTAFYNDFTYEYP